MEDVKQPAAKAQQAAAAKAQQAAEAQRAAAKAEELERFTARIAELLAAEAAGIAKLLMDCPDQQMFGAPEFALRKQMMELGAKTLSAGLDARKKTATPAPPASAPIARARVRSRAIPRCD